MIINCLTKIVYYKTVKFIIDTPDLAKVIIHVVMRYHNIFKSIVKDQGLLLLSKFWFLLCYFLGIKKRLLTTFYSQMDGQIEK